MRVIKKTFSRLFVATGCNWVASKLMGHNLFIIGYHSIASKNNDRVAACYFDIAISAEDFAKHLDYLRSQGHTFIHFSEIQSVFAKKTYKPTIIYFDDGFSDNLTVALPILESRNIKATIFVTTGFMDGTAIPQTSYLRWLLIRQGKDSKTIENAVQDFKAKSYNDRRIITDRYDQLDPTAKLEWKKIAFYLTEDQLKSLVSHNIEIGSHSVSHTKLTELSDNELGVELRQSREVLEALTAQKIETLSFPHGRSNERVVAALKNSGYTYAVGTHGGVNTAQSISCNPWDLKKIAPKPQESIIDFAWRVYGQSLFSKIW